MPLPAAAQAGVVDGRRHRGDGEGQAPSRISVGRGAGRATSSAAAASPRARAERRVQRRPVGCSVRSWRGAARVGAAAPGRCRGLRGDALACSSRASGQARPGASRSALAEPGGRRAGAEAVQPQDRHGRARVRKRASWSFGGGGRRPEQRRRGPSVKPAGRSARRAARSRSAGVRTGTEVDEASPHRRVELTSGPVSGERPSETSPRTTEVTAPLGSRVQRTAPGQGRPLEAARDGRDHGEVSRVVRCEGHVGRRAGGVQADPSPGSPLLAGAELALPGRGRSGLDLPGQHGSVQLRRRRLTRVVGSGMSRPPRSSRADTTASDERRCTHGAWRSSTASTIESRALAAGQEPLGLARHLGARDAAAGGPLLPGQGRAGRSRRPGTDPYEGVSRAGATDLHGEPVRRGQGA